MSTSSCKNVTFHLARQFSLEFEALRHQPSIMLEIDPITAWAVFSQIQLASRHPQNTGPTRDMAESFARGLQKSIATTPALATVANLGWDPSYDQDR